MHNLSHRDPKKSIYAHRSASSNLPLDQEETHLWLQQTAFEQHQRLRLELVHQLTQAHAEVLIAALLLRQEPALLLLGQTLLEAAEDLRVGELALREPGLRDDAETLAHHAKVLRRVGDDDDGFLDRRARDVGGPVQELRGIELPCTGYAEQGRRRPCGGGRTEERKVGEILA